MLRSSQTVVFTKVASSAYTTRTTPKPAIPTLFIDHPLMVSQIRVVLVALCLSLLHSLRGRADLRCWVGFPNEVKVVTRPLTCSSRCKLPCDCRRRWRLCPLQRRFLRPDGRHSNKLHPLQPGGSALFRDSLKSTLSRLHQYLYVQDPQYKLHRLLGGVSSGSDSERDGD